MFSKRPTFDKQLAEALRQNEVWTDLASTVTKVIDELVNEPRWALARIREAEVVQRGDFLDTPKGLGKMTYYRRVRENIDLIKNSYNFQDYVEVQINGQDYVTLPVRVLQDRDVMIEQARNLGFDYFSNDIQDDDYQRIVTYLAKFWKNNGGDHFVSFMGFIKRTRFEIEQLWTEAIGDPGQPSIGTTPANERDYYSNLLSRSEYLTKIWNRVDFNPLLTEDQEMRGAFYPTSHVELSYDVLDHPSIDKLDTLTLFYLLAPIHLVMHRFVDTINVGIDLGAAIGPMLYSIPQRSIRIDL